MEIKYFNSPEPEKFDASILPGERPLFLDYEPAWAEIEALAGKFDDKKNLLLIGHGGSVTSFQAMYYGLIENSKKVVWSLSTIDPDYIGWLKTQLKPSDTVVVAVSKSGETVTQLEALMQFLDFPLVVVAEEGNPLWQIGERLSATLFKHPAVGGRFTAFTETGLVPAALCGLDIKAIFNAGRAIHKSFDKENDAYKVASVLWQLEQKGYVDVFMPIYDYLLEMSKSLIVQLCHESFGKDGKGQTILASMAPESQHHTNQRFFGGPKNMVGYFIGVDSSINRLETHVPENLRDIVLKSETLEVLSGIPLDRALDFEREATIEDAVAKNIPVISHVLHQRNSESIGEFIAFWQLLAVYSALMRSVNPFDQPQVEASKKISFQKRLDQKK